VRRTVTKREVRATGLRVCALMFLSSGLCSALAYPPQDVAAPQGLPSHHNFVEVSTGRAFPPKGALEASIHNWKSEDGSRVQVFREWYKSSGDARNSLQVLTKTAARVLKQDEKKDAKGDVVGPRVELLFSGATDGPQVIVAFTDGSSLIRMSSSSLAMLRDFERQAYP
jgi:hypothetical protein